MVSPKRFYERYYENADARFRSWRAISAVEKARSVLELTTDLPIRTVIDVGCGTGAVLELLIHERPDWIFTAADIAESALHEVKATGMPNVRVELLSGRGIECRDEAYDLAILSHVLEHVDDPGLLMRECARVARWLCIEVPIESTPVSNTIWYIRRRLTGRGPIPNAAGHLRRCSRHEWQQLFEAGGLAILGSRQYTIPSEVRFFDRRGFAALTERIKSAGKRLVGERIWADFVYSHYAVLTRKSK